MNLKIFLANFVYKFHLETAYKVFSYSGLGGVWYRIMYRKQMKEDIAFYKEPEVQARIERILSQLADDESRITYRKANKFRQKRYGKDRPRVTYPQYFVPELIGVGKSVRRFLWIVEGILGTPMMIL